MEVNHSYTKPNLKRLLNCANSIRHWPNIPLLIKFGYPAVLEDILLAYLDIS